MWECFGVLTPSLTWFVAVKGRVQVAPGVRAPAWDGQTPLAEGVQARQQLGLSVVEAQPAAGTCVHQAEGALRLQPLLPGWQTLGLVLNDDDHVVDILGAFIHFSLPSSCPSINISSAAFVN